MAGLVLVVAWHAVAWKLRSNYRKPASVIRFCAVSVVVAIIAGVAIVIWADAAFALLALVVALPALAWLLQAIANRRLATRMAELRSSRVNSSEEPARALRVPAPASLRLDRRSLWTMKFDGLAGIRTDLWLMAREFLRSMWHTKFDVGRSLGDVLPRPVAGLQRHENSGDGTLFLWVFEMEPEDDVINIARQAGPVYFLRGGGILAKGRYRDERRWC